jgi:transposase
MKRYIGLDVHKEFTTIAMVNEKQESLLPSSKVKMKHFNKWIASNITAEDTVALEASNGCWAIFDRLHSYTPEVLVANTNKLKMISCSSAKTDKHDARVLAKLAAANMVPSIWVPPVEVRELRSLVAQRKRQVHMRTRVKNHMHAILMRHHMRKPMNNPFGDQSISWWQSLPLTKVERN